MVVTYCMSALIVCTLIGTQEALLGSGDSKRHALLTCSEAVTLISFTFLGLHWFGFLGGQWASVATKLAMYPLRAWLTARYAAWDPIGELGLMLFAAVLSGTLLWVHWDALTPLFTL